MAAWRAGNAPSTAHRRLAQAGLAVIPVVALEMIWEGGHEVLLVTARI